MMIIMRAIILFIILISSQILWMGLSKDKHKPAANSGRDLRFTLQSIKCFDPLGYGDDDVRIDVLIPGRDPVTFKKTMAHKGPTKLWEINEPFYFSADSIVVLKLWIKGPMKRIDTLGITRLGKIEPDNACSSDIEYKGDNFRYKINYSLEGADALDKKSPIRTITSKSCGKLD
jgi:hypothetical protein